MNTVNKILAGVLVAQGALVAVTWWPAETVSHESHALVELDPARVTKLTIAGRAEEGAEPTEPVVLEKEGEHWIVQSANGYPADPEKVDEVLEKLADIQVRNPVATKASSHASLEVSDDRYTRKVDIVTGDATHSLILGAGSGSQVNVRKVGSDEVYGARGFTAWSIGDSSKRYLDTQIVDVDKANVDSLTIRNSHGAFTLTKTPEGAWTSASLVAPQAISDTDVDGLLGSLLKVRMADPVGKDVKPEHGLDGSTRVEWSVTAEEQTTTSGYTIGAEVDSKRYVQVDGSPFVVQVYGTSMSKALDAKLADLLVTDLDQVVEPE